MFSIDQSFLFTPADIAGASQGLMVSVKVVVHVMQCNRVDVSGSFTFEIEPLK